MHAYEACANRTAPEDASNAACRCHEYSTRRETRKMLVECVCAVRGARSKCIRRRSDGRRRNPTIISPLPYHLRIDVCDEYTYCPRCFVASLACAFPAEYGVNAIAKITEVSEFNAIGVAHGTMQPAHKV